MNEVDLALLSKVGNLDSQIEYQSNAVVSKTIIKKSNGTVTLFSFDEGEGLSEHTAPFDAMVYVYDGKAEVIISGNPNIVSSGEVIIMPANEPHALKAISRFKMMLIMIKSQVPVQL